MNGPERIPGVRALRWLPIARTGLRLILRRRVFWLFLLLALANFLFFSAMVYFLAELEAELATRGRSLPPLVRQFIFTGSGKSYRDFIFSQNVVVMLFLAFAGVVLVGNDFRHRAVAFYLSKPIGKLQYFLGKLGAAAALTALITLVPAVVLFLEYVAFAESIEYFTSSQRILWAIVGYGTLVSLSSAVVMLGVAAVFERTLPTLVVWGGLFLFLPVIARILRRLFRDAGSDPWGWSLLDFWSLLRWISNHFFGIVDPRFSEGSSWAVVVLSGWWLLSIALFWWRVRGVDVVR